MPRRCDGIHPRRPPRREVAASRGQLAGRTAIDIAQEESARLVQTVLAQGRGEGFAAKMQRLDGESFIAELYVSSYAAGDRRFLLNSVVDITARLLLDKGNLVLESAPNQGASLPAAGFRFLASMFGSMPII
jgi:hypothetical protein